MLLLVSLSKVELLLINAHFSYMYVCCKWNFLLPELCTNHISLASFKCLVLQYYNEALRLYDADDIGTWRTICPRSEVQYSEDSPALALLLYFLPSYWNKRKHLHKKKSSTPTGLVWDTNMATISLFWDTNMATMMSCENTQLVALVISYTFHIIIIIFNVVIG